jgi:hypothetical protein
VPGSRKPRWPGVETAKLREIKASELAVRFAFGAAVSVGAGLLGKAIGARFGGTFLAFPAILPASLTLIQNKEGTRTADRNAVGAVLGGLALSVFAGIGEAAFGHLSAPFVLLIATVGWAATAFALYALLALLVPDACDENKDRDLPE